MAATVFAAAVVGTASPKFAAVDARRRRTGDGRFAGELDFLSNGIKPVELEGGFVALILPVEQTPIGKSIQTGYWCFPASSSSRIVVRPGSP